ncbi:hypothetical protein Bbelb_061580 [Branchiostoma belcheri]|nr:hypothetical protein Bbelb_061580 [Branchiostoma belcheri]
MIDSLADEIQVSLVSRSRGRHVGITKRTVPERMTGRHNSGTAGLVSALLGNHVRRYLGLPHPDTISRPHVTPTFGAQDRGEACYHARCQQVKTGLRERRDGRPRWWKLTATF